MDYRPAALDNQNVAVKVKGTPFSARRLAAGIGAAVLLASAAIPSGRNAVVKIGKEAYDTALDAKAEFKYGEFGVLPYSAASMMLGNEQTPESLARFYSPSQYEEGRNLIATYITAANRLPDKQTKIKSGQVIIVPISDPKGKRLGDLIDEALRQYSK